MECISPIRYVTGHLGKVWVHIQLVNPPTSPVNMLVGTVTTALDKELQHAVSEVDRYYSLDACVVVIYRLKAQRYMNYTVVKNSLISDTNVEIFVNNYFDLKSNARPVKKIRVSNVELTCNDMLTKDGHEQTSVFLTQGILFGLIVVLVVFVLVHVYFNCRS